MTGYLKNNFPAFRDAATVLRERGFQVLSPAEMNEQFGVSENIEPGPDLDRVMPLLARSDIEAIMACNAVAVHGDFARSTGCDVELRIARWLGKPIVDHETLGVLELDCPKATRVGYIPRTND